MSSLATFRRIFAHLFWADERFVDALASADPPVQVIELMAHVFAAEHVWLARVQGRTPSVPVWPELDATGCAQLASENRARYEEFLAQADDAALASEVSYVNSAGDAFRSRIDDILLQVATHGAYHRGQIALLFRQRGVAPPSTDFIGFVRGVPAAARTATTLVPITEDGSPARTIAEIPPAGVEAAHATAALYRRRGYEPPWIGYLVVEDGACVGTCAFTAPPHEGRVEIAYFTFPPHEGRGIATRAAAELIRVARNASRDIVVAAQTLPSESASTSILKKLGFRRIGEVENSEDGIVWEWRLDPEGLHQRTSRSMISGAGTRDDSSSLGPS
jgi:uncharacterized damage-inducible protein DinB/RimJ/RimL family protein N-acetyltransferase